MKSIIVVGLGVICFMAGGWFIKKCSKAKTLRVAIEMALEGMSATIKQGERGVVWVKIENREYDKSTTPSAYHFSVVKNKEEIIVNEFNKNNGRIMFRDAKCELLANFVRSYL